MLNEDQIKRILESEIDGAMSFSRGELGIDHENAMNFYTGEAEGDLSAPDVEGRSSVVDSSVADTIEWILPSILKTFTETDEAVRFDPENGDDEAAAEQESDYVNHLFNKQDGFLTFYSWFKDALLLRVGIVKTYWDETDKTTSETYEDLSSAALNELLDDEGVEVTAHTAKEELVEFETEQEELMESAMGPQFATIHDVQIERTVTEGRPVVEPVAGEEFYINAEHKSISIKDARFVAHRRVMTVSDLVGLGFDFDKVKDLPGYNEDGSEWRRNTSTDERQQDDSVDASLKQIEVYECYPLIDIQENGIAKRMKYLYVKGSEILEEDEADCVPFSCLTPYIQPHRFVGLSIYDKIKQISIIKTNVWRSLLDNLYLQNNQRSAVRTGKVNLSDLLSSRPGGVVRTNKDMHPGEAIMPLVTQQIGPAGFQLLDKLDMMRNERGGGGPDVAGQNQSLANDTAHGLERIMSAKEELTGLITRVFGETGVKDMFLQFHALLIKHQEHEAVAQLRGEWVEINPSEWRDRNSMSIDVGLGTGDRMKQQSALQTVIGYQEKVMMSGGAGVLIKPANIYKALIDLGKASGVDSTKYFADPSKAEPAQPKPNHQLEFMKAQLQIAQEQNSILRQKENLNAEKAKVEAMQGADKTSLDAKKEFNRMKIHNDTMAERLTKLELEYGQNVPGAVV